MSKSIRERANQQFASNEKKQPELVVQKEKARRKRAARVARLRALRLGKEAESSQENGKEMKAGTTKLEQAPLDLPKAHRPNS